MEIKEAIEITQNEKECNYWVNSKEYQALQKLISIAEQVERAEGIKDIPPQKLSSGELWLPMWAKTHNGLNAQWRALIVGRVTSVEKCIKPIVEKIWQEGFDGYNNVDKNIVELSTVICSLFLGDKDVQRH